MKKLIPGALVALALALFGIAATTSSAQAAPDHCRENSVLVRSAGADSGGELRTYLNVCWNDKDGGGIRITNIQERVNHDTDWNDTAFHCDFVAAYNDNGVVKWVRNDPVCNIPESPGYRVFDNLTIDMPGTTYARVILTGWPQIVGPNPGYKTLVTPISCPC